ncbi:class I SAM-dependent methyltransferase [Actinomycetospora aeridis]|uniref:Methyltransferase domain-containing protein n=1 Tax=Actinomycetospora aeridis TaxID=3129231 RepID=A0ABU8N6A8_9PSEU
MTTPPVVERWFPEVRAGGYSRVDGTVGFYTRVRALLPPDAVVVDFGAGRGKFLEDPVAFRRDLQSLRGTGAHVIGLDVDPAVHENTAVDEAHVVVPGEPLPLADASVDVVVADFVLEHVEEPAWVAGELTRVLRPGGWICARTPNRWGVIATAARAVPNRHHVAVLRRLQPGKHEVDTFPTTYRMNSRAALRRCFPTEHWEHVVWAHEGGPAYASGSRVGWAAFRALSSLTPPPMRPMLFVFLQKRGEA